MEYEDLIDQVQLEILRRTEVYSRSDRTIKNRLQKDLLGKMKNVLPEKKDIGKEALENPTKLINKLTKIEEEWMEKVSDFEDVIEEAWDRVIQAAKEDVAMARHEESVEKLVDQGVDPDDASDQAEDPDPEDIDEEDIWDHYTSEDIWQWWSQEWHHNIIGRPDKKGKDMYPLAKYVNEGDFDFQSFRRWGNHIPSVFMKIIKELEQQIEASIYDVKEAIQEIHSTLTEKKSEVFDAVFDKKKLRIWIY